MKKKRIALILFFILLCACNIIYAKYILTDEITINMTTQPFYFDANVDKTNVEFDGNEGNINLNISNNNGTSFTIADIQYDVSFEENSNYKFSVDNENVSNNVLSKVLSGNGLNNNSYNLKFSLNNNASISAIENGVLKIKAKEPYKKEISIPLTIQLAKIPVEVTVDTLTGNLANINSTSLHQFTVKNDSAIAITFCITPDDSEDLSVVGAGQNVTVPPNTQITLPIYLNPTRTIYSEPTSSITFTTKIVSPHEEEIASHTIEIGTWGSPMRTIIDEEYEIKTTTPNFNDNVTTTTNSGVFTTADSTGLAYYFRGVIDNNYVSFGNNLWRIMRVNGDGTTRLILDSPINSSATYNYSTSASNSQYNSGPVETAIENWYKNNLLSYDSYINQNTLFIHDRRNATSNSSVYRGWERIFNGVPTINTSGFPKRQLYSKKGNSSGNEYLTYPVALPSAEEIMFAGAVKTNGSTITTPSSSGLQPNYNFYMATDVPAGVGLWTMTPFSGTAVMCFKSQVGFFKETPTSGRMLKPVIEVNSSNVYKGTGTKTNPYVIFE